MSQINKKISLYIFSLWFLIIFCFKENNLISFSYNIQDHDSIYRSSKQFVIISWKWKCFMINSMSFSVKRRIISNTHEYRWILCAMQSILKHSFYSKTDNCTTVEMTHVLLSVCLTNLTIIRLRLFSCLFVYQLKPLAWYANFREKILEKNI